MRKQREEMVREIKDKYGFKNSGILSVMLQVPRHKFVDRKYWDIAYSDGPVPIGFSQTMSQPYTVAFMTDLAVGKRQEVKVKRKGIVLEVGTGSGYQAAILSKFFKEVYTVEIVPELAIRARTVLARIGNKNVYVKEGSGEWGWKEKALFDAIIVTAGMEHVPGELFEQFKIGGVLLAPVGEKEDKIMTRFTKSKIFGKVKNIKEEFGTFHFVPFVAKKNYS